MTKKVFCKKYQKEMIALSVPPMPGPKGVEIQNSISQEAWDKWKSHQTTLINEKHLDMSDPCLLYTSPSPRDGLLSRMPSSA